MSNPKPQLLLFVILLFQATLAYGMNRAPCEYDITKQVFTPSQIEEIIEDGYKSLDQEIFKIKIANKEIKILFKVRTPNSDNFDGRHMAFNLFYAAHNERNAIEIWIALNDAALKIEPPTYSRYERRRLENIIYDETVPYQQREFTLSHGIGDRSFRDIFVRNGLTTSFQNPPLGNLPLVSTSNYDVTITRSSFPEIREKLSLQPNSVLVQALGHLGRGEAENSERLFRALVWYLHLHR